jgi:hypothetical protein
MFMMYKSHKSFSNSVGQTATYSKNITSVRKKGKATIFGIKCPFVLVIL